MRQPQIVFDTNVLVAALRSNRGASYKLLTRIDGGKFVVNVSVPLILEYEAVAKRFVEEIQLSEQEIDDIIDYVCKVANRRDIFFIWRPFLKDAKDDMVLELAYTANCSFIVTFNIKDFELAEQFGIRIVTPREFLQEIGVLS